MNTLGRRFHGAGHTWLAVALLVLIGLPSGLVTARQGVFDRQSPATGHAQVVTQGIAELPEGEVVWRVVERTARPRVDAQAGKRVLGFVLATEDPVLLTNVTPEGLEDVALLAPGESFLVKPGTRQIRASMSDQPVTYLAFELVPAKNAGDVSGGTLLFASEPFTAPDGKRDIDLVRNVLEIGEVGVLPDTGETIAILATEGAVDVLPSGGKGRTLEAGESAIFGPGEIEIEAVTPSAKASGVRAQLATMTNTLQNGEDGGAAYVVAVIGQEIPPPPIEPASTSTPPAPTTPSSGETGSITLYVYDCPPGMTVENLVGDICELSAGGYDFYLEGPDGAWTLGDATGLDGGWVWPNLTLGQYFIAETTLPEGYVSYFIPGSAAVGGSPDTGYTVAIDESAPDILLTVYNLQPAPETGSITVELYLCPENQTVNDFDPGGCTIATGGFDISLIAASSDLNFSLADAAVSGGTVTWPDIPLQAYYVIVNELPRGWVLYIGPDGGVYAEGEGGIVEIGGSFSPGAYVALYAFTSRTE